MAKTPTKMTHRRAAKLMRSEARRVGRKLNRAVEAGDFEKIGDLGVQFVQMLNEQHRLGIAKPTPKVQLMEWDRSKRKFRRSRGPR